jgi:hypothetical protein
MGMRRFLIGSLLIFAGSLPALGAERKGTENRVPFVGCRSSGQLGPRPAPKLRRTPLVASNVARRLAYYVAFEGPGVLAPRHWHCFSVYGSNGSVLVVSPTMVGSADFFGGHHFSTKGDAVELSYDLGGTSGRWAVAEAIARYFPKYRNFIRRNFQGLDAGGLDIGPLPSGPYRHDSFSRRSDKLVRYTTPPLIKGAGTAWALAPSAQAVQGLSALVKDVGGPDLLSLNVRLPDKTGVLTQAILRNAEQEARQYRY